MQKTLRQLITETQRELYQSAGPSVQLYSEDILAQKIYHAFDRCFKAKFWPQFVKREVRTLDGVTGKVSAPFTFILGWEDVKAVFRENSRRPIPTMPLSYNLIDLPNGGPVRFVEPTSDATLFTMYPLDATDQIVVVGRARPANMEFGADDIVPFDHLALVYHAAWEYAVDEASNAAQAAKFTALFDQRMKQLEDDAFENIVLLNPAHGDIPDRWQ